MKEILLAACGAFVCVEMLQLHIAFRIQRKPFNCEVCLAGWFTLLLFILPSWFDVPFYMAGAMMMAVVVKSIMKKL